MAQFPGIYVALITPFTESGEVDYPRLREHVDWLISEGIHGLVPTGSCGEYAALSDQERAQVVETIIRTAAGRVPVVVGTAAPSTAKAVGWANHAKEAGAAGLMLLPPINYRPSRREVVGLLRESLQSEPVAEQLATEITRLDVMGPINFAELFRPMTLRPRSISPPAVSVPAPRGPFSAQRRR